MNLSQNGPAPHGFGGQGSGRALRRGRCRVVGRHAAAEAVQAAQSQGRELGRDHLCGGAPLAAATPATAAIRSGGGGGRERLQLAPLRRHHSRRLQVHPHGTFVLIRSSRHLGFTLNKGFEILAASAMHNRNILLGMFARFRPQQQQQQRAKSVSVDHTGSSAFVPVTDRLRLATAAAEERRRLFQTRRRRKDHSEPERISESRGSSFQVGYHEHQGCHEFVPVLP